ncbi:serine--tRNA ligase [bacterium]|nr:serine--tRNA ligase [bacterium]
MLDLRFVRANPDVVRAAIANKNEKTEIDTLLSLDEELRGLLVKAEELKQVRNQESERVAVLKKAGEDASEIIERMRAVSAEIGGFDEKISDLRQRIYTELISLPNIPHESVPVGKSEDENIIVRTWGEPSALMENPLPHWEIGEKLGLLDFPRGTKIAGSNFPLFIGDGARLARGMIAFMLDVHTKEHGYVEVAPPFVANRDSMLGTGQLPKLEDDMYHCDEDDLFLIPTGEVPVTNLYRDDTFREEDLPVLHTAYTPCFRREAGSYGKDTRGLMRVHQFDKVEMVKFVLPETSYDELESLTGNAETILQRLGIPYQVKTLCTGDLSFAAAKCYDIDVWAAGIGKWLEASSCSNFGDFQARRSGIRYKPAGGGKSAFIHTINGSGVALPRTMVAILENYQTDRGTVIIPEALRPYMDGREELGAD